MSLKNNLSYPVLYYFLYICLLLYLISIFCTTPGVLAFTNLLLCTSCHMYFVESIEYFSFIDVFRKKRS